MSVKILAYCCTNNTNWPRVSLRSTFRFSNCHVWFRCLHSMDTHRCTRYDNVDKTTVMASDGIACRILIQNEQLEQVDTFPYLGFLITEDGECTTEFRTGLNRGQAIRASLQKMWKSHSIPISMKIRLVKALVWPVRLWKLDTHKEWRSMSWRLWDKRAEKDYAGFVDSKEKWVGS